MVAKARYEITASDETKAAVASAMRGLDGIGGKVGSVGAAISAVTTGAMAAFAKAQIDNADMMGKLAAKINMSTESASAFGYAARYADLDSQRLAMSVKTLMQAQVDAQKEGSKQAEIFKALGVETREANGELRGSEDLLLDLADAFKALPDGALKSNVAVELFKGNSLEMLDMLKDGRGGLEAFRKEAEGLGVVIGGKTAEAAERFNDNIARMHASMEGLMNKALPPLLAGLEKMNELMGVQAQKPLPLASDWMISKMESAREKIADLNREIESIGRGTHLSSLWGRDAEEIRAEIVEQQKIIVEYGRMREKALEAEAKMAAADKKPDQRRMVRALSGSGGGAEKAMTAEAYGNAQADLLKRGYPEMIKAGDDYIRAQEKLAADQMLMNDQIVADFYDMHEKLRVGQEEALAAHKQGLLESVVFEEQSHMTVDERQMAAFDRRRLMIEEAAAQDVIGAQRKNELLKAVEDDRRKYEEEAEQRHLQQKLAIASGMAANMSSLMQSDSKRQFDIGKKFALANALIKGYEAIQGAYAAGAKIGGPWLGAAYAATAAVATKVNIDAIRNQQFGGGSGAAGASASGGVGTNPNTGVPQVPVNSGGASGRGRGNVLQVTINGAFSESTLRNDIIPRIAELVNADDIEIVNINSRNGQDLISAARSQ